jgi:hypothetical protein
MELNNPKHVGSTHIGRKRMKIAIVGTIVG